MSYDEIISIIDSKSTIKILRSKKESSALILSFLHKSFKQKNIISIPYFDLIADLQYYLDEIAIFDINKFDEETEIAFADDNNIKARKLINNWIKNEYLRYYTDNAGEYINELTRSTSNLLEWFEKAFFRKQEFIGTESRFKTIIGILKEINENTSENPETKILELEKEKERIEEEIRLIKRTNRVRALEDYQIISRFNEVNQMIHELQVDFKEVEDNFVEIRNHIYKQQTNKNTTKGDILDYTFDALDELRESNQGKSFYAFWNFLVIDSSKEELKIMIEAIYSELEKRKVLPTDSGVLKKLQNYLYRSGKKVIDKNNLLAEKLGRVISEKKLKERKETIELIKAIRNLIIDSKENPPNEEVFIEIEGLPQIDLVLERKLGEEQQITNIEFRPKELSKEHLQSVKFDALFDQFVINKAELQKRINELLKFQSQVSLKEITKIYPIEKGLSEILTYFSIASEDVKHIINKEIDETISYDSKHINVPQVIYSK